jgi:hypothetical protein
VVVTFGDKIARITETSEHLITVVAPSRFDLTSTTSVAVTVSNKYSNDLLSSEKLTFTYLV